MRHENQIIERIDQLLDMWGMWARKGYRDACRPRDPGCTLGRIREERDGASHPASGAPVFTQEDMVCMQVDSAVVLIPDRKIRKAIILCYVRGVTDYEASRRLKMGVHAYRARLRIARWILVGGLRGLLGDAEQQERQLHCA